MDKEQTSNLGPEHIPGRESDSASEQLDAAIPELPPDADKNERIRLANLIGRQIAYYVGQKETGTFIAFTADLAIIPRVMALKLCLVRSEEFIQAAKNCHVSENNAYAIVRLRLNNRINAIKLDVEIAKRKAEAYDYQPNRNQSRLPNNPARAHPTAAAWVRQSTPSIASCVTASHITGATSPVRWSPTC